MSGQWKGRKDCQPVSCIFLQKFTQSSFLKGAFTPIYSDQECDRAKDGNRRSTDFIRVDSSVRTGLCHLDFLSLTYSGVLQRLDDVVGILVYRLLGNTLHSRENSIWWHTVESSWTSPPSRPFGRTYSSTPFGPVDWYRLRPPTGPGTTERVVREEGRSPTGRTKRVCSGVQDGWRKRRPISTRSFVWWLKTEEDVSGTDLISEIIFKKDTQMIIFVTFLYLFRFDSVIFFFLRISKFSRCDFKPGTISMFVCNSIHRELKLE